VIFLLWNATQPIAREEYNFTTSENVVGDNSIVGYKITLQISSETLGMISESNDVANVILGKNWNEITKINSCENFGDWTYRRILDSNNKYSYCGLMFQVSMFRGYGEKYNIIPKGLSDLEIEEIICDPTLQILIADKMIDEGIGHTSAGWANCWRKEGLAIKYP
jgi:hypothetical protein